MPLNTKSIKSTTCTKSVVAQCSRNILIALHGHRVSYDTAQAEFIIFAIYVNALCIDSTEVCFTDVVKRGRSVSLRLTFITRSRNWIGRY